MFESGAAPALAFPPNTDSFTMPHTGAVAQLGERRVRNAKVGSSILLRSTIKSRTYEEFDDYSHRLYCNGAVIGKGNGLK